MGRSRGVREERTDHTKLFSRTLAGFGLTRHQKVHFSTYDGKLELQCTRNGFKTLHFVQGLSRTPLLFIPRYLTNMFFEHILQTKRNLENLKISKIDPGKLDDSFFFPKKCQNFCETLTFLSFLSPIQTLTIS